MRKVKKRSVCVCKIETDEKKNKRKREVSYHLSSSNRGKIM